MHGMCGRALPGLLAVVVLLACTARVDATGTSTGIAVYALSRGAGVPRETRDALRRARELFEQDRRLQSVRRIETSRIGIEGETRICAQFSDHAAQQAALARLRAMLAGVDLLNVVEEPCPSPGAPP
jgi:hypothetical protein